MYSYIHICIDSLLCTDICITDTVNHCTLTMSEEVNEGINTDFRIIFSSLRLLNN